MIYIQTHAKNKINMNKTFEQLDYHFFMCMEYLRCFVNTRASKANHHCVMGLVLSYTVVFVISSLPVIKDFKNEIIIGLEGDVYAATCFLYSYYSSLMVLSVVGAINLVTFYSIPFLNIALSNAFLRDKSHIVLQLSKNSGVNSFDIKIDHLNEMHSPELIRQFEIIFHNNKIQMF